MNTNCFVRRDEGVIESKTGTPENKIPNRQFAGTCLAVPFAAGALEKPHVPLKSMKSEADLQDLIHTDEFVNRRFDY
ncbi:MAG: hypothetical protein WAU86_21565 [Oricola sp.]